MPMSILQFYSDELAQSATCSVCIIFYRHVQCVLVCAQVNFMCEGVCVCACSYYIVDSDCISLAVWLVSHQLIRNSQT